MRSLFCLIFVGVFASSSSGEWRTSDQVFSFVTPNSDRFREVHAEAPFSAQWKSIGGFLQLNVVESESPNAAGKVRRDILLNGFASEAGQVIESSVVNRDGVDIYTMVGVQDRSGVEVYSMQSLARVGSKTYKLMAICVGRSPVTDRDIMACFSSLRVDQAKNQAAETSTRTATQLSRRIGGPAFLLLIVAAGCGFLRRS